MEAERQAITSDHRHKSLRNALLDKKVLGFAFIYFCVVMGSYTFGFWLPQMIKSFGDMSNLQIGIAIAVVNLFAVIAMIYWTRRSDARQERLGHFAIAVIVASAAFGVCAVTLSKPAIAMVALTFAAMGIFSALPTFWALPTSFLTGVGAAAGIALINSIDDLAGYLGPFIMGYLKDMTGSYGTGLMIVSGLLAGGAASLLVLARRRNRIVATEHLVQSSGHGVLLGCGALGDRGPARRGTGAQVRDCPVPGVGSWARLSRVPVAGSGRSSCSPTTAERSPRAASRRTGGRLVPAQPSGHT
ncbi:MFS transporter [Methylobacterium planeticum]|uniref:MFS transporter n=1 Tax=Methylobacterium planeticum TaxID=2615211 RepID=A0A6N6MEM9_9HYPH|nr:MFS transporter [Methylobacterium planeticum]KAB1069220.1 MFS transporter [Methylobacterium planeticum]